VRFPGLTNRNYKIACEDRAFFVKINRCEKGIDLKLFGSEVYYTA
jgi:Ser/Thr protein kinase RdoA (MazF antagonist)